MTPLRVVLVDDHEFLRGGLRLRLEREPATAVVGEASNARDALAVIGRTLPDLVVLDLGLPDRGGIDVAADIRASWPRMKIIVLTGDSKDSAPADAIRAGADGFVFKEDSADSLIRAIPVVMAGGSFLSPVAASTVARTLRRSAEKKSVPPGAPLAEREREVLKGIGEGLSYKEIAARMQVSVRTVETYRVRLVRKIGVSTRAELARFAVREGLVKP